MAALAELNRVLPFKRTNAFDAGKQSAFDTPSTGLAPGAEDEEDWAAIEAAAQLEAEAEMDEGEDVDMDVLREIEEQEMEERQKVARQPEARSSSSQPAARVQAAGESSKGQAGRARMVFEEEEDFGAFGETDLGEAGVDVHTRREYCKFLLSAKESVSLAESHAYDYSSKYGNVSNLNMSALPSGYIDAAPVEATTLDGRKVSFARRKKLRAYATTSESKEEESTALMRLASSMLERPYDQLVRDIEYDKILARKQREADASNGALAAAGETKPNARTAAPVETSLWTDRYRPKRFIDLLGDERVHRTALLWLKEWDMCVFKGTSKANAAAEMKRDRRNKRAREGGNGGYGQGDRGATSAGQNSYEDAAPDPWGRPQEKILLLSGPPGLGKTTLAHVLARQARYQVLEINASDDRTGRIVEDRIRNALDSQALTSGAGTGAKGKAKALEEGKNRPTCVIVDEIDGAAGGGESSFVKTLVKLVTEGSTLKKPNKKGKGKQARPLLRPIICICNDLYAPVLRPLRPLAKIVRFTPPTSAMLVKRLRTICEMEELTTENKHLSLLVETAEGDLRSCLNTLQFIKRNGSTVDANAIRSSALGQKDTGTSSAQVLNRIFKKPPRKRGAPGVSGVGVDERYVARIVRDVQTSGEYEKISQGCFENYLTASGTNAEALPRIVRALDWIWLYDQLDHRLRSEREYELLAYVPFAFVAWYPLFSSQIPNPMYLQRQAHQEVADAFAGSITQNLKALFTGTNVVTELLPLLNRVVAPDLKPVNSQIVKTDEKARLTRLVNTMITTKLTFALDKSEDGQLSYKLDPPIDVFVHFEGKRASDIAPGRFAVRQMINREIEAESQRRGEVAAGGTRSASDILAAYKTVKPVTAPADAKQAVDYFGRAIASKANGEAVSPAVGDLAPPAPKRVRQAAYRYHEGFSNAVRVTKRVSDFF
ncbi:hypothetical protein JCM10908_002874 [Rhodotorula pacifica]|uniref:Ctf18p n=1 Tax=Rhodotorula pacifica TaxID=1495444 RepID=UPI00316C9C5B